MTKSISRVLVLFFLKKEKSHLLEDHKLKLIIKVKLIPSINKHFIIITQLQDILRIPSAKFLTSKIIQQKEIQLHNVTDLF